MVILRSLILGFVFLFPALSFAETISATSGTYYVTMATESTKRTTPEASCQAWAAGQGWAFNRIYDAGGWYCVSNMPNGSEYHAVMQTVGGYVCPTQGGWTLQAQNCTRPDCPSGTTRNATTGACESPCQAQSGQESYGWTQYQTSGPSPWGPRCKDGCEVYQTGPITHPTHNPDGDRYAGPGYYVDLMKTQFTGASCGSSTDAATQTAPPNQAPPVPRKEAPCASNEGVMTSSSGKVSCVPPGTPGSNPPIVTKSKDVQQFPDGSTKTTETTTTRDPATGAETKTTNVTVTAATGGQPGSAGTPGTTSNGTSTATTVGGNGTNPEANDFCQKNPGLDICTDKLAKEETAKGIKEQLEKLNAGGGTDYSAITNAEATQAARDQLTTENGKLENAVKGVTDVTQGQRSSWQSAMESGWFEPVAMTGCSPFVMNFAGKTVTIDHCQKASLIASILEYALWFSVVVGTFVMFTGGTVRSS